MTFPTPVAPCLCRLRYETDCATAQPLAFKMEQPGHTRLTGEVAPLQAPPPASVSDAGTVLELIALPPGLKDDPAWRDGLSVWLSLPDQPVPLAFQQGELHLNWRAGRAVLTAPPALVPAAIEALAEFTHYEGELRRIERELAADWLAAVDDTSLGFDVTPADVPRLPDVGRRMQSIFHRRLRYARIEPYLHEAGAHFPAPVRALGDRLREAARCSVRAETADGQLESQEYVYEMASQRIGEFRHAREGFRLEVIIIALLAAEVVLMAVGVWSNL